ncbi:MAG: AcrB/AcrD/AcrF family protein [Deltaproteobacteria bacterium HGW-Deltaproteobacteria-15]|jgi:CzcA family heavy metal efflux pump|nr:MAG: AcrB/AcrD/AcrF family protein [Deltaproteobacteria bacterium HGW-Deltaproteobacteria-15]
MNLARFALHNPITVLMAVLGAIILGAISFSKLPVDMFPEITYPSITVATFYPGANPQDIERTVTYPVEKAVSTVNGVKYVSSISRQGASVVTIYFNWGTNLDSAQSDVLQSVNLVHGDLPRDVEYPIIRKFDVSQISVIYITLMGGGLSEGQLYDLAYNVIEPEIEHVPNIASARVVGGKVREIQIHFDRQRLQAFNLSPEAIIQAVQQANLILPSGDIKAGPFDYRLFTETQFSLVRPIEDIIVTNIQNHPLYIRDVAEVRDDFEEQTNLIRVNGQPAVALSVQKTSGTNTIQVVDDVRKAMPKIKKLLPPGVEMLELFDQSVYIRNSIKNLQHEALIGAVLAVLVILIFLRNVRSTLIVSLSIPISIVCAFSLLYFSKLSVNMFTLGGLALGVGRLVDDAIVVLENIYRHRSAGESPEQAAIQGSGEVGMAVLASTITTIVVFLPVVFITGIAKLLFTPLALTVAFSLIASYFVSLTVIPVLSRKYLHPETEDVLPSSPTSIQSLKWRLKSGFDRIDAGYQSVLTWTLRRRKSVVVCVLAVLIGSLPLYFFIGSEFFPSMDESQFRFWVQLPVGSRLEESERVAAQMEEIIDLAIGNETEAVQVNFGMPSGGVSAIWSQNTGPHMGWVRCKLVDPGERSLSSDELMEKLRPKLLEKFPGVKVFFTSGGIVSRLISFGNENPIDVEILGYELKISEKIAEEVAALVRSTPGAKDVRVSREQDYPQQNIVIDRVRAALMGLSVAQVARAVQTFINGYRASIFSDPQTGNQYNITVRAQEKDRASLDDLSQIFIFNPQGQPISLDNIAEITRGAGPIQIERKYQQRVIHVTANTFGRDLGSVAAEIQSKLDELDLPANFKINLAGAVESQQDSFYSLMGAFLLAVVLVYMVLASQFKSLLDPFIIMFSVPLGLIGVLWALFLTETNLSVTSFMGVIMMAGIVVSNGILLIDYTNRLRAKGLGIEEAVVLAGRTRLRPILMTTLCTILGLIPMAVGLGEGSESNAPMAIAVIGGLSVSTLLTLVFIPTLYTIFEIRLKRVIRPEE